MSIMTLYIHSALLVLRMRARMDDAVHVEVEIVELDAVGVGLTGVNGGADAVNGGGLK